MGDEPRAQLGRLLKRRTCPPPRYAACLMPRLGGTSRTAGRRAAPLNPHRPSHAPPWSAAPAAADRFRIQQRQRAGNVVDRDRPQRCASREPLVRLLDQRQRPLGVARDEELLASSEERFRVLTEHSGGEAK